MMYFFMIMASGILRKEVLPAHNANLGKNCFGERPISSLFRQTSPHDRHCLGLESLLANVLRPVVLDIGVYVLLGMETNILQTPENVELFIDKL
jgi:hypothetical protein